MTQAIFHLAVRLALIGAAVGAPTLARGADASAPEPGRETIAVFGFAPGEREIASKASSLDNLVAAQVAGLDDCRVLEAGEVRSRLGDTREQDLGGCARHGCLTEIAKSLGAEYVVQGRLDRFGTRYLLTAQVTDAKSFTTLARLREDVADEEQLPAAADRLGRAAAEALQAAVESAREAAALASGRANWAHLNVKLGHLLPALDGFSFDAFTMKLELEGDYYLRPYLLAYLEAGIILGRASATEGEPGSEGKGIFSLVPVSAGLKYVFRSDTNLRPYVGLGLGLGILAALVEPAERKIGLHFNGLVGLAWLPWRRVGFNLETSVNFDDLKVTNGSNLLFGFNANFGILVMF